MQLPTPREAESEWLGGCGCRAPSLRGQPRGSHSNVIIIIRRIMIVTMIITMVIITIVVIRIIVVVSIMKVIVTHSDVTMLTMEVIY